jgi:hypothetical protein
LEPTGEFPAELAEETTFSVHFQRFGLRLPRWNCWRCGIICSNAAADSTIRVGFGSASILEG